MIHTTYNHDSARILFSAPVTADSIFALCTACESAIDYYKYGKVELQINSPGGESDALRHFSVRLGEFQKRATVATTALNDCASAAALILSSGSLGHRSASIHSRLLYHRVRMSAEAALSRESQRISGLLTARSGESVIESLRELEKEISRDDLHHFSVLRRHINLEWFRKERQKRGRLINTNADAIYDVAKQGTSLITAKERSIISAVFEALTDPSIDDLTALDSVMNQYSRMLDLDKPISPVTAWSMFLIDQIDGQEMSSIIGDQA